VFGRATGSVAGFQYSPALSGAGIVWDAAHLDAWLADPRGYLPGNRMAFAGLRNEIQRRDLIAYLMVESAPTK
jgi:cytochrome c